MSSRNQRLGEEPDIVKEADDYYDLLNVEESATPEEIKESAKQLMKENHPDVSDVDNAKEIFKALNKAQQVLTDEEKRTLYDSLGHDQYVRRSEEGEITLTSSESDIASTREANQKTAGVRQQAASNDTLTQSEYLGEESSNSAGIYSTITSYSGEFTITEWINKSVKEIWTVRYGILSLLIVLFLYSENQGISPSMVPAIPTVENGLNFVMFVTIIMIGVSATTTEFAKRRMLLALSSDIEPGVEKTRQQNSYENIEEEYKDKTKEDQWRGTTTVSSPGSYSSGQQDSIDIVSRFDTKSEDKESDLPRYRTRYVRIGRALLYVAIFVNIISVFLPGSNPWVFLFELQNASTESYPLWADIGSAESSDVIFIFNIAGALIMFLSSTLGMVLMSLGISDYVWHERYRQNENFSAHIWDTAITISLSLFVGGILVSVYHTGPLFEAFNQGFVGSLLGLSSQQGISLSIIGLFAMVFIYVTFVTREFMRISMGLTSFRFWSQKD